MPATGMPTRDMPISTGEFRARPDASASTAEFRAFVRGQSTESEPPWAMSAPGRNVAKMAAIVVGVAVVLILIAVLVLNA
jgi:hypothetical protein